MKTLFRSILMASALIITPHRTLGAEKCPMDPSQYAKDSPEFTVATVRKVLSSKDLAPAGEYLTDKGRSVLAHLNSGDSHYAIPESNIIDCRMQHQEAKNAWYQMTFEYGSCPNNMPGGPYVCEYILRKQSGKWMFDDILIKNFCGLKMEVEMSMIQNNLGKAEAIIIANNPLTLGGVAVKEGAAFALDKITSYFK